MRGAGDAPTGAVAPFAQEWRCGDGAPSGALAPFAQEWQREDLVPATHALPAHALRGGGFGPGRVSLEARGRK